MMGETGPMGLHSKGRKTDMKTAAKRERKTLRIVELALLLGAAAFLMTGVWALNTQRDLADKVVRLHVLANSDTEEDQALKLLVRDAVLERATEILEQSADRAEAEIRLRESLPELEAIAEETVRANGYDYAVTAELEDTAFPTKEYDGFSLPAGEYLALRILIGEGVGQNWWCVVFPPLCTAASADVPETALAAGLTEDQVSLMTEEDGGGAEGGSRHPGGLHLRPCGQIHRPPLCGGPLHRAAGPPVLSESLSSVPYLPAEDGIQPQAVCPAPPDRGGSDAAGERTGQRPDHLRGGGIRGRQLLLTHLFKIRRPHAHGVPEIPDRAVRPQKSPEKRPAEGTVPFPPQVCLFHSVRYICILCPAS